MKCIHKLILFGACFLLFCFDISGQVGVTYNVKSYNVFNGLSNNWVSDIFQDEDGFMWFATQYGLNRFDGKSYKKYTYTSKNPKSLTGNWVRSILQLSDGKLYIGTLGGGIDILDPHSGLFENLEKLDDEKDILMVNNLTKYGKENLWISSTSGAYKYSPKNQTLKRVYNERSSNISVLNDGRSLIASKEGLFEVKDTITKKLNLFKGRSISNILRLSNNKTLVYIANELYSIEKRNDQWVKEKLDFDSSYISNPSDKSFLFQDNRDWIWLAAGKKIWKFSPDFKTQIVLDAQDLLGYDFSKRVRLLCIFQDRDNDFWIGTNAGAFQLIENKSFRHPILGAVGNAREIVECQGKMWVTLPDGLYNWDKSNRAPLKKVSDYRMTSLACASNGVVYGLFKNESVGILKINAENENIVEQFFEPKNMPSNPWRIIEDANKRLWITQWDHMMVYDTTDGSYFRFKVTNNNVAIVDMFLDKDDTMWLATISGGLLKFSNASQITKSSDHNFKRFLHDENDPNSISSNLVMSLHQTNDGKLWIGTDGGLNRMDIEEEKFTRYMRDEQMPDDKILNITNDKNGILWFGTISHGITSFDPESNEFNTYTVEDGLYDNSMLLSSIYRAEDGYIWMGSERGVNYFYPEEVSITPNYKPNLIWSSYVKHRKDTSITRHFPNKLNDVVKVSPEDQNVSFQFLALTFKEPENVRYQFWLQGFHNDWLPIQEKGLITLSYLPKGKYKLHVRASSSENKWEVLHEPISVIVLPPWYKTNVAYLAYSLFLMFLIYSFYKIQLRRKIAETEKEHVSSLAEVKTRWFNQIAHEFRTPLTVILGAVDQMKNRSVKEDDMSKEDKHLHQIQNQANHLSNQVHQILEIAQMQEDQLEVNEQIGDFVSFQKYLLYSFKSLAKQKEITLAFSSSLEELPIYYDEDKWRKITTNLVSNAIKYNTVGGKVSLQMQYVAHKENSIVKVIVEDSGIGISSTFQKILYDPFTRSQTENQNGVGLGLTLTKELVELMDGSIEVKSKEGVGTTFTISAPVKSIIETKELENSIVSEESSLSIVLVAEDHKEVQEYIQFCLASSYKVVLANNGQEAWDLCQKYVPDLVISDVMMPKWDGIKLGTMIRSHIATDHIPLIFLTAKANQHSQIEGLKIGADAYLAKPFDREELLIRVNHLIQTRTKLREKYNQEDVGTISENQVIDGFIQSVIDIVKDHMDDDEFSVPLLAEKLHMSRVHLFRKIKNLTGMPPTKFIRKIRLQHARDLLNNKEYSIAEIAYQTGFKDPAYFTRVYVEEFGKPPSESRK
ncbi:hybrid sensor histidine kinase/response regulator transcription factor [uncultured Aquimarina sp.]|uniref:hybrid sensor histidine kinase/response regulator transcription factor n=1 Tax=uncultured Aquimarina sp. TaxID=575652 RepID=UPI00261409EA|nr:hybrid sensor histidine kinase/response regulator transcription factor [uncultured Aquimarina sp.]